MVRKLQQTAQESRFQGRRDFLRTGTNLMMAVACRSHWIGSSAFSEPRVSARESARLLFSPTLDDLGKGTFLGAAVSREQEGIAMEKPLNQPYQGKGTYLSVPIAVPAGTALRLSWRERWTTPVAWDKGASNPVLAPAGTGAWDAGSLTAPCVIKVGEQIRLYYGSRPKGIGICVASVNRMHEWKKHPGPILGPGKAGAFDAGGVSAPEVVPVTETHWHMYYVGYHPTEKWGGMPVHQIGLAESNDAGLTWHPVSEEPVIPHGLKGSYDGFSASTASVLRLGEKWWMWYGGIAQVPYLASVCLATSTDGHSWKKFEGNPVLGFNPYLRAEAFLVARPHVLYEDGIFKMWYSAKGFGENRGLGDYRICYAESRDGIHWDRFPKNPVVAPSESGWDQKMVEYAEVLRIGGDYHMWFCADRYESVGYAKGRCLASVFVQTRSGHTPQPDTSWSDWSPVYQTPAGSAITSAPAAFLQIRFTLQTEDREWSPVVQDIQLAAIGGGSR